MDHATILAAWGDDEVMILLKHIISLLEQAKLLPSRILLGKSGEFLSLVDLQQAIDRCDERLTTHNPDHPLYSATRESLDTLAGVVGVLSLLAPRVHSQTEQQTDTPDSQIVVEKSENNVDDIHAPIRSPFNVENNFGRAPMQGMRNSIEGLREEAGDTLCAAEMTRDTEVENEADVNREKPGTQHTAGSQGNFLAVESELQLTRQVMIATKGTEKSPGIKIVGGLINSQTGLMSSETRTQAQDSTDVVGEVISLTTDVRVAEMGMSGSSSRIEADLSHTSPLGQPTYWESGSPLSRLEPTMADDLLEALVTDDTHNVAVFGHLSVRSSMKYKETGAMSDLRKAIMHGEKALAAMPQNHDDRATNLNNLAANLHLEYKRTGAIKYLQRAIMSSEEALAALPQGHSERAGFLNNLAIVLGAMYKEEGAPSHLQQAIRYSEKALAECHRDRTPILDNLASELLSRYNSDGDVDDLKQAIIYAKEALAATSQDHPDRAYRLSNLAASLHHRSLLPNSNAPIIDLSNAILFYKEALSCNMSPPYMRIMAARLCVNLSCELQVFRLPQQQASAPGSEETSVPSVASNSIRGNAVLSEAASLLESAVLLLPQVSPRSLERQHQQHLLKTVNGIAEDAASFSLLVGNTGYHALKLLELSRGVIQGFAIDCRNDLSDLKKTNISLFNKFNDLREEIDDPRPEYQLVSRTYALERRETAIREMEKASAEIRELPGHKEFQLPPSPEALMSMAKDGPIVVVISSVFRSYAIIVTSSTITTAELPKLIFGEIPERLGKIAKLANSSSLKKYLDNNKQMLNLLSWLWDVAVQPVIQSLHLTATTEDTNLTHIWWIGVGAMSVAPFHAAGYYSRGSDPSQRISSYAISSYTPTIKALSYARERDFIVSNGTSADDRILLVAMQETPGYQDLPNAVEEVARIMSVAEISANIEYLDQPSAEDIIDRLQSCQTIHFACHGIPDDDPSHSHLVLLKNGEADKLIVQAVSSKNGKAARLAYLSACCTATARDLGLADESIHIASGFQLAGFSHVLATMWEANSKVCADVSTEFYRSLFNSGGVRGHREVAMAFHRAVNKVRVDNLQQPLKWAPFIHVGA